MTARHLALDMKWGQWRPRGQDVRSHEVIKGALHEGEEARTQLGGVTRPLTSLEDEEEVIIQSRAV